MRSIVYLCMLLFFLTGCVKADYRASKDKEKTQVSVQNTAARKENYRSNEKVAKHLSSLATSIPSVKDSTAVVIGPYAVVGIDVDANLDRSRVETIKYSVAESLQHDPNGAKAVVVADPDLYERLQEMRRQLQSGRPAGVMEELAAIVGRVMPQVPNDTFENQNIRSTRQNDDQMHKNEQQKLKNEQNDQSNSHMNTR
ncbi:YhcN/YlaJ family sporulation lipoprotein [Ectobacillus funiculus]|uniref:YhcN/YlaJ family sporulation lipoprotein n=1 Tax=Ectobacillus funiculus TaxID=137993 RepID=UPI0039791512